jgi:DNA-binding PadR family transcriptional regulator
MVSILHFSTSKGRQRGILSAYILYSLRKQPKSGYELLAEITEKTKGHWIPSKGTIYPLLKQLKQEGVIQVKTIDKRSKHIYEITTEGKKILASIRKCGMQMEEQFMQFRSLVIEISGRGDQRLADLLLKIRSLSLKGLKEKKNEIIKILETCHFDLQKAVEEKQ